MAMIRTPKTKNLLDEMPSFAADPTQQAPQNQASQNWNLYQTQSGGAIPIPQGQAPSQEGTNWPTFDQGDFDNHVNNYWAPDRRRKLIDLLGGYQGQDKQQKIDYYANLSEQELWPNGNPGGSVPEPNLPGFDPTPPPAPPTNYQAPPGFDQGKLNDPTKQTDKYKAARVMMRGGGIDDVLKELGAGWHKLNQDTIVAPDGSVFDLFYDFGGSNQRPQWTHVGGGPGSGVAPPPPAPGQTNPIPPLPAPQAPGMASAASTAPNFNAQPLPGQMANAGQAYSIGWQPGTRGWQADSRSQGIYQQVALQLMRSKGSAPTPDEVWSFLDYEQKPDENFLRSIIDNIARNVPPDAAPAPTAPSGQGQTDPYVDEYRRYLDEYLKTLASQRERQTAEQESFRGRQAKANESTERLIKFIEERTAKLKGPAYTGAEGEVFRTQALDPIESDRAAAKQRALERISSRGIDPNSGIAQQLLNDVDKAFDQSRAGTQNQLAYRQIEEQRSREQEAQQLMGFVPELQRAAISGDVDLIDRLDSQIRNSFREGMGPSQSRYNIPNDALQQMLAALGVGPNPNQLIQMLMQQQQYGQGNSSALWGQLGSMLPYLLSAIGGAGGGGYTETHGPPRY